MYGIIHGRTQAHTTVSYTETTFIITVVDFLTIPIIPEEDENNPPSDYQKAI